MAATRIDIPRVACELSHEMVNALVWDHVVNQSNSLNAVLDIGHLREVSDEMYWQAKTALEILYAEAKRRIDVVDGEDS